MMQGQCCCDCTLRSGTITIGIVNAFGGIANIITGIVTTGASDPDSTSKESLRNALQIIKMGSIVIALMGSLLTVLSILLIFGAAKNKPLYLLPWMTYIFIYIITFVVTSVMDTVAYNETQDHLLQVYSVTWAIIILAFETYFFTVAFNLYRVLRGGASTYP